MPSSSNPFRSPLQTLTRSYNAVCAAAIKLFRSGLFRAGTLSLLDQAVVSGVSFATSVLIGRACGAKELGAYYLAFTIVMFARGVQEQLVGAPYMIYCQRKDGRELESFAGSAAIHQLILSAVCTVTLSLAAVAGLMPSTLQPVMFVMIGALPMIMVRELVREMSFAHLRPGVALAVDIGIAVMQLGAFLILSRYHLLTVALAYIVIAVSCGVASLVWFLLKPQRLDGAWAAAKRDWFSNWQFSRWALASQILGQTSSYVMPWALAAAYDEKATGVFGACATLVGLANMFVMGLGNSLSPRCAQAFARGGLPELKSVLKQTILLFACTLIPFAIFAFLGGEWVAVKLYSARANMAGTGPIIGILALGVVANGVSMACGNCLWAMERPAANFRTDVLVMITVVVGSLTLVPMFGPMGAALSTLLVHCVSAVVRSWTLARIMREVASAERNLLEATA